MERSGPVRLDKGRSSRFEFVRRAIKAPLVPLVAIQNGRKKEREKKEERRRKKKEKKKKRNKEKEKLKKEKK